jgi:hypothetical protein
MPDEITLEMSLGLGIVEGLVLPGSSVVCYERDYFLTMYEGPGQKYGDYSVMPL